MRTLNNLQVAFLLEYFFKNEKYPGWKNIAKSLLDKGRSIVPGSECIWCGGIGNFITLSKPEGFFDCVQYNFDLENFLSSAWFIEIQNEYLEILNQKREELNDEIDSISSFSI